MSTRFLESILVLGVLATLLALIDDQVGIPGLHWAVVVVPILISVLIALASRWALAQRWAVLRAAAESVKSEIYQYRTLGKDHPRTAATRQQQLASRLDAIGTRLMAIEASSGPLTPYQGPLPPETHGAGRDDDGLSPLDADRYLQIRVGDQLAYFHNRVRTLSMRRNLLQFLAIASGVAGAILAVTQLEVWIGLTAGASAAALAYLGYMQVDNTIVTYNQIASRLAVLERAWRAHSPAQQNWAAFRDLVMGCETVLSIERPGWVEQTNSGWVQQMNDALQDLRSAQASAASSIELLENSKSQRVLPPL